jgi:pilus assembly protein FimV
LAKINPVKLKQDADKLEKAGKLEQSIAVYRQIIDDNPRDWNTINKVGDLYAKLDKNHEASEEYAKVADFYAKDGFLLKAIALWKKINRLEPAALGPYVNLAELYAKQGLMMEAKGQYQIVVEEYIKRGKMRDAGEMLKKMAEIDPTDLKVRSKLADLFIREGNQSKAIDEHVAIAEELTKKGHLAEAAQVLEKGLKLDAKNARLRLELARVYTVQKNFEKAAGVLEEALRQVPNNPELLSKLAEAYLGCKKIEEAEATCKRLLELNPNDPECRVQMGRVFLLQGQFDRAYDEFAPLVDRFLERREGERAAALLQQIAQVNPSHVKSLVKLAEVYRILNKDPAVVATYTQLVEAYMHQNQPEQAAAVLEMLVSLEPQNQQHRTKLEFVRGRQGSAPARHASAPAFVPAGGMAEPDLDEEFDLTEVSEEFPGIESSPAPPPIFRPPPPPAAPSKPRIELSGPVGEDDREFIDEHLAEGKVFRKYGLVDKAAEQFEAIVARFADHGEARLELREVYREKNQVERVVQQTLALAEICRLKGDNSGAQGYQAEAAALAPAPVAPPAPPAAPKAAPAARAAVPPPAPPPLALVEEEEEIHVHVEDDAASEAPLDLGFADVAEPVALAPAAPPSPAGDIGLTFDQDEESAAGPLGGGNLFGDETASDVDLPFEAGEAQEDVAVFAPPTPPPPPPPLVAARAAAKPRASQAPALPPDLKRVLDEVEEYVSLGFVDDARDSLREVRERYADHPAVQAKVRELGLEDEPAAVDVGLDMDAEFPGLTDTPVAAPEEFPGLDLDIPEPEPPPPPPPPRRAPEPPPQVRRAPEPVRRAPTPPPPPPATEAFQSTTDEFEGLDLPAEFPAPEEPARAPEATFSLEDHLGFGEAQPESEPEPVPAFPVEEEAPSSPLSDFDSAFADLTPPESEPTLASEDAFTDLGAELFGAIAAVEEAPSQASAETLGDAGLADIFREFKKGVDKQLGQEDYDTRYNLGIAYKEMGLIDEAIAEFQLAAKDPTRLLECSSMLGICFLEKGMPKLAIKWFDKGLTTPGRLAEEYLGLRYDLAAAYEADGDVDHAIGILLDLNTQDPSFRDVGSRLRELRALASRS